MIHTISQFKHLDGYYLRGSCREDVFKIWRGVCQVCGKKMKGMEEMDVGHRVPQSHQKFFNEIFGGEIDIHNLLNLQAEHINCNRAKKNRLFHFKPLLLEAISQSAQRIARYERKNKVALSAARKERVQRVVAPLDLSIYPILKHSRNEDFPELTRQICVYLYKNAKEKPVLEFEIRSKYEFVVKASAITEVVKPYLSSDEKNEVEENEPAFFQNQFLKIMGFGVYRKYLSGKNNKYIGSGRQNILAETRIERINGEVYIFYYLPFRREDLPIGWVKTEEDWLEMILTKPLHLSVYSPRQAALDILRKSGKENIKRVIQSVLADPAKQHLIAPRTRMELEAGGLSGRAGQLAANAYAEEVYGPDWHNVFLDLARI
jgi:hypothetical protein